MFPYLAIFILFLLALTYFKNRATKDGEEKRNQFWERENASNKTRKQDISNLDYLVIPVHDLPIGICKLPECQRIEQELIDLSKEKILNLNGLSNTDLKLTYGAPNLPTLSEYDQNYARLVTLLYKYGKFLKDQGFMTESIQVLEYGVSIKADMSKIFLLLGSIYHEASQTDKIETLILKTSCLSPLLRESTKETLKKYLL